MLRFVCGELWEKDHKVTGKGQRQEVRAWVKAK